MPGWRAGSLTVCATALFGMPCSAFADTSSDCASAVSDEQSVVGYSTLLDGQPPDPNSPTLNLVTTRSKGVLVSAPTLQTTLGKGRGACDANISLQLPSVQSGHNSHTFSKTMALSWEQRWHTEDGVTPTIATELQETVDYSGSKTRVSTMATFVVAKTLGPKAVVLYGSGALIVGKSSGYVRRWTPAAIVGIKVPARAAHAIVVDLVMARKTKPVLETSLQFNGPFGMSLGPGASVQFKRKKTFTIGIGIQKLL